MGNTAPPCQDEIREIGHRFANVIGTILGSAELALSQLPPDAVASRKRLARIIDAAKQGRDLTWRLQSLQTDSAPAEAPAALPPAAAPAPPRAAATPPADPGSPPRGSERILLIDDDRDILTTIGEALVTLGYHVTTRTAPRDAMTLFRSHPDAFDLVITDMKMPECNGVELARALHAARPETPIVLCTGNDEAIAANAPGRFGFAAVLEKPIRWHELALAMRDVLDPLMIEQE